MIVKENINAFMKVQNELIRKHHGKVAVFCKGKLIVIEKDLRKALKKARRKTKEKEIFVAELYTPEEQSAAILIVI